MGAGMKLSPKVMAVTAATTLARTVSGGASGTGKLTQAPTFRVGCIGQVNVDDIDRFLSAVDEVCTEMGR